VGESAAFPCGEDELVVLGFKGCLRGVEINRNTTDVPAAGQRQVPSKVGHHAAEASIAKELGM